MERLHNASMTNMLIRDVPEDVHARLVERAAAEGVSLQQLALRSLTESAARADLQSAVAAWGRAAHERIARPDYAWPMQPASELIEDARRERDEHLDELLGR